MIRQVFKSKELRNKLFFTLFILLLFRIGKHIPVPGVDTSLLSNLNSNGMFSFMNIFSGGALGTFSLFAVGVMPYITASIIVQLLQMDIIPKLSDWAKQGEYGQKKIKWTTRIMAVFLAIFQSLGISIGFNNLYGIVTDPSVKTYAIIALVLTIGTVILMFFGEMITKNGLGNGMSIIIFSGIVSGIPNALNLYYESTFVNHQDQLFISIVKSALILLILLALVTFVVFVQQSTRKIPVEYAKRVVGSKVFNGYSSHIPFKINSAGVIPVIFAVAIIIFPSTIAKFFKSNDVTSWIINSFDYTKPFGMILYAILIILFSFFYAFVQMKPEQLSEDLHKQGGFIPGIRPGKETKKYLSTVLVRLTVVGALFLAVVALLPMVLGSLASLPSQVRIGGTSILIVINVAIDTVKQIKSKTVSGNYKTFIKK